MADYLLSIVLRLEDAMERAWQWVCVLVKGVQPSCVTAVLHPAAGLGALQNCYSIHRVCVLSGDEVAHR